MIRDAQNGKVFASCPFLGTSVIILYFEYYTLVGFWTFGKFCFEPWKNDILDALDFIVSTVSRFMVRDTENYILFLGSRFPRTFRQFCRISNIVPINRVVLNFWRLRFEPWEYYILDA